jgi:hypothetical protein
VHSGLGYSYFDAPHRGAFRTKIRGAPLFPRSEDCALKQKRKW